MKTYEDLVKKLSSYENLVVAFSGGVDSTFLAKAAYDALGEKAIAVTIKSPYIKEKDLVEAKEIIDEIGIRHHIIYKPWDIVLHDNPKDRCYLCKLHIFQIILNYANKIGFLNVAEGSNLDDTSEYRPGHKALKELEILTPMVELSLTKDLIRSYSKKLNLSTWDKPSSPCLLTRFPYQNKIEKDQLLIVEKAEEVFISRGYDDIRVRFENNNARIEMPYKMRLRFMMDLDLPIMIEQLKSFGFDQISLDLQTFRHASEDEKKDIYYV